jgi:hypothetical protein
MRICITIVCAALLSCSARAADASTLYTTIKGVTDNSGGAADARAAWKQLVALGPDALPGTLAAMDDASPLASNWLRAAVDAIAENAINSGKPPDPKPLEAFLRDTKHTAAPRRLAYEWLTRLDKDAPARLLPALLEDPSAELRRDAVAYSLKDAQKRRDSANNEAAKKAFQKLFAAARDFDQVDALAEDLKKLGDPVDLPAKYGFITRWMIIGPFDNTNKLGYARAYPPEEKLDLKASFDGKGGKSLKWIEHTTTDAHGVVDLNKALGKSMGAIGYAFAAVESPAERAVEIRAGSNNAVKIFLNGKPVFVHDEYHHGSRMDQHIGRGVLKTGRNEVLIKTCQNEQKDSWAQRWDFQLRICDAIGGAVPVKVIEEK